jgi:PKD repeat protein
MVLEVNIGSEHFSQGFTFGSIWQGGACFVSPNQPPQVNAFQGATINEGATYSASGSFTDTDSASWSATVNYGDGSGAQPLSLNPDKTFSLNHTYQDDGTYTVTVSVTDNQGAIGTQTATVTVRTPAQATSHAADQLQDLIEANPNTPLSDKLEDALAKTQEAQAAIAAQNMQRATGLGAIEGAVGDIQAAVNDGLLDTATGNSLMQQLSGIARQLALDEIEEAQARGGNATVIQDAQSYFNQAEQLRSTGTYKDSVGKYKDAIAKAESA